MVDKQQLLFEESDTSHAESKIREEKFAKEIEKIERVTQVVAEAMEESRNIKEEFKELFAQIEHLAPMLEKLEKLD